MVKSRYEKELKLFEIRDQINPTDLKAAAVQGFVDGMAMRSEANMSGPGWKAVALGYMAENKQSDSPFAADCWQRNFLAAIAGERTPTFTLSLPKALKALKEIVKG